MKAIKFDEEKVLNCIKAYHDMHGEYPYLICNNETRKMIPKEKVDYSNCLTFGIDNINSITTTANTNSITTTSKSYPPEEIKINYQKYIKEENVNKSYGTWYGAKIIIDNSMGFGEVHVG